MEHDAVACANTDCELWRDETADYLPARLFVTEQGAIGIDVGGDVIVKTIREWWRLGVVDNWDD